MGFQYSQDDLEGIIKNPTARILAFRQVYESIANPNRFTLLNNTLAMGLIETACILRIKE
jgi:hypothetical protein